MANTKGTKAPAKEYTAAEKRENWKTEGNKRTARVLRAIQSLQRCARPSRYTYTMDEVSRCLSAVAGALDAAKQKFQSPGSRIKSDQNFF